MNGAELIAAERQRQIEGEGWTAEHDDKHDNGELARAAVCYAEGGTGVGLHEIWPWFQEEWKPSGDRVRDLTKAGALIAAEIDRLQRLARSSHEASDDA